MNTRQHADSPDGPDGPDTSDLGFRDDAEERAYEKAQDGPGAQGEPGREQGEPGSDTPTPTEGQPPQTADEAVDAQAEPDDGEPANAG